MSEWYDYLRDRSEEAKALVVKYPFLRFKNNACCPWESTEEIKSCWMFDLPTGWENTCAKDMCDELLEVLGKYADDFIILQLKEKFNEIRLYWRWTDREYTDKESNEMKALNGVIQDLIHKYTAISYNTCTVCGKPATKWTTGWIASFCDECYERMERRY